MNDTNILVKSLYFHIGNGGITFKIISTEYGPEVEISSSHFGNNTISQKILVSTEGLQALGNLFLDSTLHQYNPHIAMLPQ